MPNLCNAIMSIVRNYVIQLYKPISSKTRRKVTPWRYKSTPTRKAKLLWITSHYTGQPLHELSRNTISRFHLKAHYVFHRELYPVTPTELRHNVLIRKHKI